MRKFNLIPEKIKRKYELSLLNSDFKDNLNKVILKSWIACLILGILITFFFTNELKNSENFFKTLIEYYSLSVLISIPIIIFYIYSKITLKKVKRRKEIEFVLADYLDLVAANLTAGMPIDQAMWYAVRERFGILAKEIEFVARRVMAGEDLERALLEFTNKYDSDLLKKSMTLLIEGLKSGGELSNLVSKIAWNIKETQLIEKEIRAEITTYVIFITFASIIIAPFLYALSHRIIIIMSDIISKLDLNNISSAGSNLPLKFSNKNIISGSDFKIFIYINLFITSTLASMLVSTIRKGEIKAGLKLIPIFIIVSFILFLFASIILTSVFKGVIA